MLSPGIEAKTVNRQLAPAIAQLAKKLPPGYTIEAGGTIEESAKGLSSIVAVFPLMIMLMLIILMVQLQSFQKMFLVISVAPLGSDRRGRGLVADRHADGLRRDPRHHRLERHDHPEFGDPDRPDRHGSRQRASTRGMQ